MSIRSLLACPQLRRLGFDHGGDAYRYAPDDSRVDRAVVHEGRVAQRWVATTCGYCSVGCGMLLGVRDNTVVAVQGDPDHPVNRGRLCPKGLSEHHTINSPDRLVAPTRAGKTISWDTAIDTFLSEVDRITDEHGPDAFAVVSTGQLVTEEFYALGKLVRLGLGITNYDGNTTLCMASAVSGYKQTFGTDGPPGCYEDLELADVIVLIGANIADNHPLLAPRLFANRDASIVVVDPRATKTASLATVHIALAPRTDITLLNGVIRLLIEKDLVDHDFIREHTSGFVELAAAVEPYTPDRVAQECGISVSDFEDFALLVGRAERLLTCWTMGVNHSEQGTDTVALINTLHAITGQIGRPGAAPLSITGQCNAMGTRETGFTASMPGYRSYDNPAHRAELANLWGVSESRLPTARGRAYPDIVDGIIDGTIKGLWVIGTNPVVSFPDRARTEAALGKLEFLVTQDGYPTPTTDLSHLVLPAAIWGEKDGTYSNTERRVSAVRAAVSPPGEAKADFDIFLAIAQRAGVHEELFPGWVTPADARTEWRRVSAGRPCDYSTITDEVLGDSGGSQWPGKQRLYSDGLFHTADGRARLSTVSVAPLPELTDDQYPYVLNTGRTVEHWHTRTKTGRVPILEHLSSDAWVEIHPSDAECLGVMNGTLVTISSRRGAMTPVRARVTSTVRPGEVFVPFHFEHRSTNSLTIAAFDPVSREPNYKQCAVRLSKSS